MNEQKEGLPQIEGYPSVLRFKTYTIIDRNGPLQLVPISLDAGQIARSIQWELDSEVAKYYSMSPFDSVPAIIEKNYLQAIHDKDEARFEIVHSDFGPVGHVFLSRVNPFQKNALVGIMVGEKSVWRKGIGKQAVDVLLAGVKKFGMKTIEAKIHIDNEPSIRLFRTYPVTTWRQKYIREYVCFRIPLSHWNPPESMELDFIS